MQYVPHLFEILGINDISQLLLHAQELQHAMALERAILVFALAPADIMAWIAAIKVIYLQLLH